jgi:hypothetical protein
MVGLRHTGAILPGSSGHGASTLPVENDAAMSQTHPRLAVAGGYPEPLTPARLSELLGLGKATTLRALHQALRDEDPASWPAEPPPDPLVFAVALLRLFTRPGGVVAYARAAARAEDEALPGALQLDLFDAARVGLLAALEKAAPESAASLLRRAQGPLPPALPLAEAGVAAGLWVETALLVWAMACRPRGLAPEVHALMEENEGLAQALAGVRWRQAGEVPLAEPLAAAADEKLFGFAEAAEPLLPPASPDDPLAARIAALPEPLRAPLPADWSARLARAAEGAREAVEAAAAAAERAALEKDEAETALREAALRESLDHDALARLLEAAKASAGASSRAAALLAQAVAAAIAPVPGEVTAADSVTGTSSP